MTLPETRRELIAAMRRARRGVLIGGPPCTRYSMAGTRDTALGIQHLYYMLEVGMGAECCRLLVIENVPGLQSAPELAGFLRGCARRRVHAQETLYVKGKDAHLAQTRDRVFYLLARPGAGEHDAARMHAAMAHARELLAHAKSQAAYTSVREATGDVPDSRGERRALLHLCWAQQRRQTGVQHGRPRADHARQHLPPQPHPDWRHSQDAPQRRHARPRRVRALGAPPVAGAARRPQLPRPRTVWPEPQEGEVTAYAQFLANAVAPAMADLVGGIMLQSGLLHDITDAGGVAAADGGPDAHRHRRASRLRPVRRTARRGGSRDELHAKAAAAPAPRRHGQAFTASSRCNLRTQEWRRDADADTGAPARRTPGDPSGDLRTLMPGDPAAAPRDAHGADQRAQTEPQQRQCARPYSSISVRLLTLTLAAAQQCRYLIAAASPSATFVHKDPRINAALREACAQLATAHACRPRRPRGLE